ncbi:hypothetical protein EMPS_06903 [Entomortierella parvispora]|uniref:Galactose oxidase n=1 Tax=Entomortierella parvispora TaxID=205924 RepID=A0A9P3LY65_9FUNG|nr:hypothetical protein EMPS_06903 [Entomortierella parvispora]
MIHRILNTTAIFFISCAISALVVGASPTVPFVPVAVGGAAYGKAGTRLLVVGGNAMTNTLAGPNLNQFFALDLTVPWQASSPAWIEMNNKSVPTQTLFTGAVSVDGSLFVTFRSGNILSYRYRIDKDEWSPSAVVVQDPQVVGLFPATDLSTDSTSGNIYVAGGYQGDDTQMYVYDPAKDAMLPSFSIPSNQLLDRNSYAAAYVKSRQSIFYFGGIARNGITSPGDITEFVSATQTWSTLSFSGNPGVSRPPHRVNLCMVANDDGTKVVVFGGVLDNSIWATDIWVLDVQTLLWTMGPVNQLPRQNPVCAIAGNTFVAWGGFDPTDSIGTTVLYDIGLNQMVSSYTPSASYVAASNKGSKNIIIISTCSVLAIVVVLGLSYWIFRRRKTTMGSYLSIGSSKRNRNSEPSSFISIRDSVFSSMPESATAIKMVDYLEHSGRRQEHPLRPVSSSNRGTGFQPYSVNYDHRRDPQKLEQQQYQQQQQRSSQPNRTSKYEYDPYPIRQVQDPHAYRPQDDPTIAALKEKRILKREIEKQKLELELQKQQMKLEQQRQELLRWNPNRAALSDGVGVEPVRAAVVGGTAGAEGSAQVPAMKKRDGVR